MQQIWIPYTKIKKKVYICAQYDIVFDIFIFILKLEIIYHFK